MKLTSESKPQEFDHPVLSKPIIELAVSEEFLKMAEANKFRTLSDILATPLYEFHTLPESGYRMLREFLNLLDAHGLMRLANR